MKTHLIFILGLHILLFIIISVINFYLVFEKNNVFYLISEMFYLFLLFMSFYRIYSEQNRK